MKKNLILAVMAALMMVSCAEKKTFEALNGEWKVVTIGDMAVARSQYGVHVLIYTGKCVNLFDGIDSTFSLSTSTKVQPIP